MALAILIAGLLALVGRHLPPAFRILLEALALLGRHGLVLAITLKDLLLLLRRQPLEAVVRRVEFALTLLRQRLEAPEVLLHPGAVGGSHSAKPLIVLARHLALFR